MKTNSSRFLSFVIVLCVAFSCIIAPVSVNALEADPNQPAVASAGTDYVETDFGEGKILITTVYNGSTYYLPATTTTSAPSAVAFTDVSTISEEHLWTVTKSGDNYYIQNSAGAYLYTTNANTGVRVSSTDNAWFYNATENSLKDTKTSRFLGIYNAADWRCYTTVNQSNYKESSTSFKFYKLNDTPVVDTLDETIRETLNDVQALMALGFTYSTKNVASQSVTDTLDNAFTGATSSSYIAWTNSGASGADYAGLSSGGTAGTLIQLNSNSNRGIVTTASGGKATKITVTWDESTTDGRTLDIYGSNKAYAATSDLYGNNAGEKIGSIEYGTSTELEITGDYQYIGIRSNSGALYLGSIEITWESEGGEVVTESEFAIRCAMNTNDFETLANLEGVTSVGIQVKTAKQTIQYTDDVAVSWKSAGNMTYIVIGLGKNLVDSAAKLGTEFTVSVFIEVDDVIYTSTAVAKYSVGSLLATYYNDKAITDEDVAYLYEYLAGKGLID